MVSDMVTPQRNTGVQTVRKLNRPFHYPFAFILFCFVLFSCCTSEQSNTSAGSQESISVSSPLDSVATPQPSSMNRKTKTILVLGNSLAAGYGLDPSQAFPALLQEKIDELGWDFEVINAGLSGETTAGGLRRIDWLLRSPVDVLILELGGNDGLRGIPPEVTRDNLRAIVKKTRERYPDVQIILAGMQVPPNLGETYTSAFRDLYPELAREESLHLVPFLLEGVGDVPDLNQ